MNIKKQLYITFITSGFLTLHATTCPSGWYSSGNWCVASSKDAMPIVLNNSSGSCPSGWYSSGNWCVANSRNAPPIVLNH